jgi:hypothetical protein
MRNLTVKRSPNFQRICATCNYFKEHKHANHLGECQFELHLMRLQPNMTLNDRVIEEQAPKKIVRTDESCILGDWNDEDY